MQWESLAVLIGEVKFPDLTEQAASTKFYLYLSISKIFLS